MMDPLITLGTVPYLNVQPNLWALEKHLVPGAENVKIIPEVPRRLAANLYEGQYDSAIVPVFEYFRHPGHYTYVPGPIIGARGAVHSVMLYSSQPLEQLRRVYLDVSSLTSVHLFQVIAAEIGLDLEYLDTSIEPVPLPLPPATGWVVIGDPAMRQHNQHPYTLDLGEAWQELTGLSFVFAAWLVPQGVNKPGLTEILNASLEMGLQNLPQVAADSAARFGFEPDFALRYFEKYIYYRLGDQELAGWHEFGRLLHKHGFIQTLPELRPYTSKD